MEQIREVNSVSDNNRIEKRKIVSAKSIVCPYCGKTVNLIPFGMGWVGVCCDKIVYNSRSLPED